MAASGLDFFNNISGELEIELTVPAQRVENMSNLAAPPDSQVIAVKLWAEWYDDQTGDFRDLNSEELTAAAFREEQIKLRGESGDVVTHHAPNGEILYRRRIVTGG